MPRVDLMFRMPDQTAADSEIRSHSAVLTSVVSRQILVCDLKVQVRARIRNPWLELIVSKVLADEKKGKHPKT